MVSKTSGSSVTDRLMYLALVFSSDPRATTFSGLICGEIRKECGPRRAFVEARGPSRQ